MVAVLLIEDIDKKELWQNCGALVYDRGMPTTRTKSRLPLIGTFFNDNWASVVLGTYECVVLNMLGICIEMAGPGNVERLLETCRTILIDNHTDNETSGDTVSHRQCARFMKHSST